MAITAAGGGTVVSDLQRVKDHLPDIGDAHRAGHGQEASDRPQVETHSPGRIEGPPGRSIQRIAVPVIGSPLDDAAIATARALAARLDAELVFIHAAGTERGVAEAEALPAAVQDAGLLVVALRASEEVIGRLEAAVEDAGLVVVGLPPPGAAPSAHRPLAALVARAPAPMLLVRPGAYGQYTHDGPRASAGGADVPLHPLHLIAGLDGSAEAEALLPTLAELARAGEATITLVRAVASNVVLYCAQCGAVAAQQVAISYLQRMALTLQEAGVVPAAIRTVVRFGDLADALRDQAVREQASILIAPGHPVGRRLLASGFPPMPHGRPEGILRTEPHAGGQDKEESHGRDHWNRPPDDRRAGGRVWRTGDRLLSA
jgi:nucleotide-binding universal stress UspA family protein